jgi:hypothetical protein
MTKAPICSIRNTAWHLHFIGKNGPALAPAVLAALSTIVSVQTFVFEEEMDEMGAVFLESFRHCTAMAFTCSTCLEEN